MSRLGGHFRNNKRFWYGLIGAAVIVVILLGVTALATAHIGKQTLTGDFAQAGGVRPGDKVRVELTPYDLSKGRITYRAR